MVTVDGDVYPEDVKQRMEEYNKNLYSLDFEEFRLKQELGDIEDEYKVGALASFYEEKSLCLRFSEMVLTELRHIDKKNLVKYLDVLGKNTFNYDAIVEGTDDAWYGTFSHIVKDAEQEKIAERFERKQREEIKMIQR